jgi:osmotically-inducible protein OsmY
VLRKEVCERLAQDDELDLSHADVLVADGIVLLLGSVPEFAMKRRMEHVCETVNGVREIHDQLLVGQVNADAEPGGLHTEAPRAGFRGPGS